MNTYVVNLGQVPYGPTTSLQHRLLEHVAMGRLEDVLLVLEHDPVFTLGADFHEENLSFSREYYESLGYEIHRTDRGGDITYHAPGQIVIYPIFNLARHGKDLHKWLRNLEEAVIVGLEEFGIEGSRFPPYTGVWIGERKICAIGVKVRRWTSMHGIALNCNNDLNPFELIVPCGIKGYAVTSLSREVGTSVSVPDAEPPLVGAFGKVFHFSPVWLSRQELSDKLLELDGKGLDFAEEAESGGGR